MLGRPQQGVAGRQGAGEPGQRRRGQAGALERGGGGDDLAVRAHGQAGGDQGGGDVQRRAQRPCQHHRRAPGGRRLADLRGDGGQRVAVGRKFKPGLAEPAVDAQRAGGAQVAAVRRGADRAGIEDPSAVDLAQQRRGTGQVTRGKQLQAHAAQGERAAERGRQRVRAQARAGRTQQRQRGLGGQDLAAPGAWPRQQAGGARVQGQRMREEDQIAARGGVARQHGAAHAHAAAIAERARRRDRHRADL